MFDKIWKICSDFTFLNIYSDVVSLWLYENKVNMLKMRFSDQTLDQTVIFMYISEVETSKDVTDQSLESFCNISYNKTHAQTIV